MTLSRGFRGHAARPLTRARAWAAAGAMAVATTLGAGDGRADPVKVGKGETYASIAASLYGDASLEKLLRAANGAGTTREPTYATVISAPNARPYKIAPGDTWPTLAAKYLGDPRRAALLARANGLDPAKPMPPVGTGILLPFLVKLVADKGDTWGRLAATFYGDARKGDSIREYNLAPKAKKKPKPGEEVYVPIFHARITTEKSRAAVAAAAATAAAAAAATAGATASSAKTAEPGAPLGASSGMATSSPGAARSAPRTELEALLTAAEAATKSGEYASVIAMLAGPLDVPGVPAEPALLRSLLLLGTSYVALGDDAAAVRTFSTLFARFPEWKPDPVRTSPKVLKWVEKARP